MNFPPFWARGASGDFSCWRWSSNSVAEAQSLADQAAQQLAGRFEHGDFPPKHGGNYPNRPFREPVIQEIKNDAGETAAVMDEAMAQQGVINAGIEFLAKPFTPAALVRKVRELLDQPNVPTANSAR